MLIYSQGRNNEGDIIVAEINVKHIKAQTFVISEANKTHERTLRSPSVEPYYMDAAFILAVLASLRGISNTTVQDWYLSGRKYFTLKPECLNFPPNGS